MTDPIRPPPLRDPLAVRPMGHVPPAKRSRAAMAMASRAAHGLFVLQACTSCEAVSYPPRDRCPACWGALEWRNLPIGGEVLAETTIRTSTDKYFRDHLPWRTGTVRLDAGPVVTAHLHGAVAVGARVRMALKLDRGGAPALFALPDKETPNMQDDPQLRQFIASPKHRRVLVSDGRTALGQAVASALVKCGAQTVFLGNSTPLLRYDGQDETEAIAGVEPVALDLADTRSVQRLAAQLGGRVDILINTAGYARPGTASGDGALFDFQTVLDVEAAGLMRLAQTFGPAMSARSGDGDRSATAIVDIVSVYGLTGNPAYAGMSAASAARMTLLNCLRGEMHKSGIRVMSVLTGPVEDDWHQQVPPPKVTPARIATAVVDALEAGREVTTVGDVASDLMARWQDDPMLAVREENQ